MYSTSLRELEDIVYKAHFHGEFLEYDIQNLLSEIFMHNDKIPSKYFHGLKLLLLQISNLDKSTNFGYFFYELLQENLFPFCEDVLRVSVKTEKCYNLNDKALKSFIITNLINNMVEPKQIIQFDRFVPEGHGTHFLNILNELDNTGRHIQINSGCNIMEVLFFAIQNNNFPQTQKKVSCIVSFLNIKSILPSLIGKSLLFLKGTNQSLDDIILLMHYLRAIQLISGDTEQNLLDEWFFFRDSLPEEVILKAAFLNVRNELSDYLRQKEQSHFTITV